MKRIEKIEVRKGTEVYYYTGILSIFDEFNVLIETTRGEILIFRKEQIEGRRLIEMKRDELNETTKKHTIS